MTAAAVVAASAPKRHGFSIESLIGRRDDSPGRRQNSSCSSSSGVVCRPFEERALPDRERARDRDFSRGSVVSKEVPSDHGARDGERRVADRAREGRSSSLSPRLGTASPSSTDDERNARVPSPAHSASPSGGLGLDKSLSPETENRFGPWSREDFKHLLVGSGAFGPHHGHHAGHHHHHQHTGHALAAAAAGGDHEGASLYQQPLRVCNRSLAAAMNTLMGPHQGLGALPVNPLLYSLQRDIAHHQSAHSLLAARYSGFMHPRYPIGPPPGLLFHPYRKPKRNRTAFSPSQLLQLEQAFEKNHYVVGQERKTLASKLQLTETQVKVWFQNRRTKHKRMKAEEEASGGITSGDDVNAACDAAHSDAKSDASDHDMEDDVSTDDEEELSVTEDS